MIRIITPKEYTADSVREITQDSHIALPNDDGADSEKSSDDEMEVEVVNTEEIANEKVYKVCSRALIVLICLVLTAFYLDSQQPSTVTFDGIPYIELPTAYSAVIHQRLQKVSILVPNESVYEDSEASVIAQMCITHQRKDCQKELLFTQGFMFLESEKWLIDRSSKLIGNVLVLWEERLMLSVLMLALNLGEGRRIDVLLKEGHTRAYVSGLKINLQSYGVANLVKFIFPRTVDVSFLQEYGLVVGSHEVYDNVVYPEHLQRALDDDGFQSFGAALSKFLTHTHFLLFYEGTLSSVSVDDLRNMPNQVTSIAFHAHNYEIFQEIVLDFRERRIFVVVLDGRKKSNEQKVKEEKSFQIEQTLEASQEPLFEPKEISPVVAAPNLEPLKHVRRVDPPYLLYFFECADSTRNSTKDGDYYSTELHRIKLRNEGPPNYLDNIHFYNFFYHLLLASEPCNLILMLQDEMAASLAAATHQGLIFVPFSNYALLKIKETITENKLKVRIVEGDLNSQSMPFLIASNQIQLTLISSHQFISMYDEFVAAIGNSMDIVMKLEGGQAEERLLELLVAKFFIYVISRAAEKQFDTSCIQNFDVAYFDERQFPLHSYLYISKREVYFEDVNPSLYFLASKERHFRERKHACIRNFHTIISPSTFNLKKGTKTLIVDDNLQILLDQTSEPQEIFLLIKRQQGILQFLRNSLLVGDKIAILEEPIKSPYLLAAILQLVSAHGELHLYNPTFAYQTYIQKLIQANTLETIVESMQVDFKAQMTPTILDMNQMSVLVASPQLFASLSKALWHMDGLLVLLPVESWDEVQLVGRQLSGKRQYLVVNVEGKENAYKACQSYQLIELGREGPADSWEGTRWMAIIL